MNLYKVEYNYNDALHKSDVSANMVEPGFEDMTEVFAELTTHVLAEDFLSAVDKFKSALTPNKYLTINKVEPVELDIRLGKS